jgi:cytochrome c
MFCLKVALKPGVIKTIKDKTCLCLVMLLVISCNNRNDSVTYYNDTIMTQSIIDTGNNPDGRQVIHIPARFGIGSKASSGEIEKWDIDISPDGKGLPGGYGDVSTGKVLFAAKCASCHGNEGNGGTYSRLVGVMGDTVKAKTIGNYWPWSTTLFDYIRRAMPYTTPGSLKDDEVYSLTAYLLYRNKIIDSTVEINAKTLPKVVMPAQQYFVNDDRRGGAEIR